MNTKPSLENLNCNISIFFSMVTGDVSADTSVSRKFLISMI